MGLAERIRKRKFDEDDPMRDLHVPRIMRRSKDGGKGSDANGDEDFDRDEVRNHTEVMDSKDLA